MKKALNSPNGMLSIEGTASRLGYHCMSWANHVRPFDSLAPYERRVIELLRNSKDKRARKLAKKRVRAHITHGITVPHSNEYTADTCGLLSLGRSDVRRGRSMSCKVSLLSPGVLVIRSMTAPHQVLALMSHRRKAEQIPKRNHI